MAKETVMNGTEEIVIPGSPEATEVAKEEAEKTAKKELIFHREKFTTKKGGTYWGYFVSGVIRGKLMKADFIAKDKGGYELLNDIFSVDPEPHLRVTYSKMGDTLTKEINEYMSFEVYTMDPELGVELSCGVRPNQDSDKSILKVLLALLVKQQ